MPLPLLKQQESLWAARKLKRQPPIDVRMAASCMAWKRRGCGLPVYYYGITLSVRQ